LRTRIAGRLDDFVVRRFMLERNPDQVYGYVIAQRRDKGLM